MLNDRLLWVTKPDKVSVCWELLLRIDSMVITGMISTGEAFNLRKLVMDFKVCIADVFSNILQKGDVELLAELLHFSDERKKTCFHIVHICTEMAPVVSVGSLASYVTELSHALQRKENFVEVILPNYASMDLDEVQGLRKVEAEFYSYYSGQLHENTIWTGVVCGIGVTFIQPLYYSSFFSRERIYGYPDDFERFTYFSRAALDYIVKSGKQPDVLHIHNWQTAIVGPLFWDIFVKQGLEATRILLTCHGFEAQCLEQPDKLALCGLNPSRLHRPDRLQDNIKPHLCNILKGGVVYSNKVVIMSSMDSKDEFIRNSGHGLEATLAIHKDKLLTAPYGFDDSAWDPSKDKFLPAIYTADDIKGKALCKAALQQRLGLPEHASTVLVGCMFSEVSDVILDKLKAAVSHASGNGVQFIFMGLGKVSSKNSALEYFQEQFKVPNVKFINKYEELLSHLIFAGSDIILCHSFHDPVLQVPLKAIKYGAAPIAVTYNEDRFRHVIDRDFDSTKCSQYINTTFANLSLTQALDEIVCILLPVLSLFSPYNLLAFLYLMNEAVVVNIFFFSGVRASVFLNICCLMYLQKNNPFQWNQKIMDAMARDFSWDAECYDLHFAAYTHIKNL